MPIFSVCLSRSGCLNQRILIDPIISWPGNVRELRRVIQQSAMLTPGNTINPEDLRFEAPMRTNPLSALPDPSEGFKINEFLDEIKLHLIRRAMGLRGDV